MGRACVEGILARCSSRMHASDDDWVMQVNGTFFREFPEGTLAKRKVEDASDEWSCYWCSDKTSRPIDQGPLADIECRAREMILFGPPGGPGDGSGPRVWGADEGALFATAIRGSYRLMPRSDDRGTLLFVRDDFSTDFLGEDTIEELKRTADRRLRESQGDPIRVWVGRLRLEFHGLGIGGVVGQVELTRGTWLFLVRAGEDRYDIYMVKGGHILDRVNSYNAAALARGDLGQLFDGRDVQAKEATAENASEHAAADDGAERPRRSSPHRGRPPHTERAAPPPAILSEDDRNQLEQCFMRNGPFSGEGSSEMAAFYAGLRELSKQGLPDMRIKTPDLRVLVEQQGKSPIHGCDRTLTRAGERVLGELKFGSRDGHWWNLPFAKLRVFGEVVQAMLRARFGSESPTVSSSAPPSTATPPASRAPSTPTPPSASTSAPHASSIPTTPGAATPAASSTPAQQAAAPPTSSSSATPSTPSTTTPMPTPTPPGAVYPTPAAAASSASAVSNVLTPVTATLSVSSVPASHGTAPPATSSSVIPPATSTATLTPSDLAPAAATSSTPPLARSNSVAAGTGSLPGAAAASAASTVSSLSPDAPTLPHEIGSPVQVAQTVGDQASGEPEDDGHFHPTIRRAGEPIYHKLQYPPLSPDEAPSRFAGTKKKARGPP